MLAIPKLKRYISSKIKTEDFQNYWRKANEKTSSSISGLHFGHYKSAAENKSISKLHAMFLDTTIKKRNNNIAVDEGIISNVRKTEGKY